MSGNPSHKWLLVVIPAAKVAFDNLQSGQKQGVFRRLREILIAEDPYSLLFVEMLKESRFERVLKFRVGDYRIFFVIQLARVEHQNYTYKSTVFLLYIRNRKEAYYPLG